MASTPNYVSNSELASRISTLVDRWNLRENQMLSLLTQDTGTVKLTDGVGREHTLRSYRQLLAEVEAMVDDLTGLDVVVGTHAMAAQAYANQAGTQAVNARSSAENAGAAAAVAADHAAAADAQRAQAAVSASHAQAQAQASLSNANESAASAAQSANSALLSAGEATKARAATVEALQARDTAQDLRDKSKQWASASAGVIVGDGLYSARHYAEKAAEVATGALIYMGQWDASTGTAPANATKGDFYKIVKAGSIGGLLHNVGDQIIYNGGGWDLIDNTESVTAVNGMIGNVWLTASTLPGLGFLATQGQVDWQGGIKNMPATFTPSSHGHHKGDVGLSNVDNTSDAAKPISSATQEALNQKASLGAGSTPTFGSVFVNNGYVYGDNGSLVIRGGNTSMGYGYFTFDGAGLSVLTGACSANYYKTANGQNGLKYEVGTKAGLFSGDAQHAVGIKSLANSAIGYLTFGASSTRFGWDGSNLVWGTDPMVTLFAYEQRVGSSCKHISDWNQAITTGTYMSETSLNGPLTNTWFTGNVIAHNTDWVEQEVTMFTVLQDRRPKQYRRYRQGGVWTGWRRTDTTQVWVQDSQPGGFANVGDVWLW
jgi:hypothetical protein